MIRKVAIVGSGSWATALVKIFSESGLSVSWLVRNQAMADYIHSNGHNPRYLSFVNLNLDTITPVTEYDELLQDVDLVIFAIPSAYLENTVANISTEALGNTPLAVSIKGFIPGTGITPSRFLQTCFQREDSSIAVFGGPCHAEEIANGKRTYFSVSGADKLLVERICNALKCPFIHTIANNDPVGIEYVAILKNIIGIASGIANGLHYGDNFQAVLVSNAMREVGHFVSAIEPGDRDLFQSTYFGDLLVTAYSDYSRNRTLGKLVGKGVQVNKAIQAMEMTAEGYYASAELAPLIRHTGIQMPVMTAVHRILHMHANPFHEFRLLEEQFN